MSYQLLPDLSPDDYAALKADIAEHGVQVAVELDEDGAILDGHNRVRAWTELRAEGVPVPDYPTIVRAGLSEAEKRAHVRRLNLLRRHLSREQRRELIAGQLLETPNLSSRAIGAALGVSPPTVDAVRADMATTVKVLQSDERTGRDGRTTNTANIGRKREPDPDPDDFTTFSSSAPVDVPAALALEIVESGAPRGTGIAGDRTLAPPSDRARKGMEWLEHFCEFVGERIGVAALAHDLNADPINGWDRQRWLAQIPRTRQVLDALEDAILRGASVEVGAQ